MRRNFILSIFCCAILTSCGGADKVEYLSCEEYINLDDDDRTAFVENLVLRDHEEEDEKWSHQRIPFPENYAEKLKIGFDRCEQYDTDEIGILDLLQYIRFDRNPPLKGQRKDQQSKPQNLTADSTCAAFNEGTQSDQAWIVDDLIRGTGMRLNRDFSSHSSSINRCMSSALQPPCAAGLTVGDAMAVCLVSY